MSALRSLLALALAVLIGTSWAMAQTAKKSAPAAARSGKKSASVAARSVKKPAPAVPVPDSAFGFSHTSVFATPAPPPVVMNDEEPGAGAVLPRMFLGAPPRIPHGIADFLPITAAQNPCLECHDRAQADRTGAVPIPLTHYHDLRRAPGVERSQIAGTRYVCVSCHVPLTQPLARAGDHAHD